MIVLPLILLLASHVPGTSARRGGGIGGEVEVGLNLDSVETATLSFYIIFAVFTALQLLTSFGALKTRQPTEDFPRRVPFVVLIICTIVTLVITYVIGAVAESQEGDPPTEMLYRLNGGYVFTRGLSHVFLYSALLLLLDYRSYVQASQYGHKKSKMFATMLRSVSIFLLSFIVIFILIGVIIRTAVLYNINQLKGVLAALMAYQALYHLYIAFYLLTTAAIYIATLVLWKNRRPAESSVELLAFDTNVLARILNPICPIITIRALYELAYDVISFDPASQFPVDYSALALADILIIGLSYYVAIYATLGFGIIPKPKDSEERGK